MARNFVDGLKGEVVVSQVKEVSKSPCKSSSTTALSHTTIKGLRELLRPVITL
jgi:hypothetical protein